MVLKGIWFIRTRSRGCDQTQGECSKQAIRYPQGFSLPAPTPLVNQDPHAVRLTKAIQRGDATSSSSILESRSISPAAAPPFRPRNRISTSPLMANPGSAWGFHARSFWVTFSWPATQHRSSTALLPHIYRTGPITMTLKYHLKHLPKPASNCSCLLWPLSS